MVRNAALALAWWLCGAGGAAVRPEASADPLLRFFPTAAEVPGLRAIGAARTCGGGEELTVIYDGGFERYLKAGVTRASQRYFRVAGATVEVTLHQMKSEEAADTFLTSLCKDIKAQPESRGSRQKGSLCTSAGQDSAYGYVAIGKLLAMASFDRGDRKAARAILEAIAQRAASSRRPP